MPLRERISQDLINAQKNRDAGTVETLRFLLSAIKYKEVDKKVELPNDEVIEVLGKQIKTHKESIEAFKKGGRTDLVDREKYQLKILESYLPEPMSEAQIKSIITEVIESYRNAGKEIEVGLVMREVMPRLKGKAEGSLVRQIVSQLIQ